ncbi:hypothetical protein [Lentibacillus saliphilus]|uniref:hypothetical protein n=1 Tax=Lentibacillus saliphilus TaxID=2737028 RepID=UPI001C2F7FB1|nr:hypothetical protein [Lentibacillus saliphilus]
MINAIPVLIMILIVPLLIYFTIKWLSSFNIFTLTVKRWVFPVYTVILIVAFGLSFFLPLDVGSNESGIQRFDKEKVPNLYIIPQALGSVDLLKDYKVQEWVIPYDGDVFGIDTQGEEYINNIGYERKAEADGQIEATFYVTPYVIDNLDMTTDFMPEMQVTMQDDTLVVKTPTPIRHNISVLQKEFPIRQFAADGWLEGLKEEQSFRVVDEVSSDEAQPQWINVDNDRIFSTELLYLKIPANMEVKLDGEHHIFQVFPD